MTDVARSCGKCGSQSVSLHPVLHHFLCAYVGPAYDFADTDAGVTCPKCHRILTAGGTDWEILGDSSLCASCGDESCNDQPAAAHASP